MTRSEDSDPPAAGAPAPASVADALTLLGVHEDATAEAVLHAFVRASEDTRLRMGYGTERAREGLERRSAELDEAFARLSAVGRAAAAVVDRPEGLSDQAGSILALVQENPGSLRVAPGDWHNAAPGAIVVFWREPGVHRVEARELNHIARWQTEMRLQPREHRLLRVPMPQPTNVDPPPPRSQRI